MSYKYRQPPLQDYEREAQDLMAKAKEKAVEALRDNGHYSGLSPAQQTALRELHELNSALIAINRASWHLRAKSKIYEDQNKPYPECD